MAHDTIWVPDVHVLLDRVNSEVRINGNVQKADD